MFFLYFKKTAGTGLDLKATYHDLVELLGAYYYVALGFAIRTLKLQLTPDPVVALLGPLGFFGVLIAAPVLLEAIELRP